MKMQKNKKLVQAAAVGLSVCVLAGGGLFVWNMYGKNAEENEKQIVSDEVAEIESLNTRDKPSVPDEKPSVPDEKPSVPDEKPSVPDEKPSVPDEQPSTPQKPALPQVNEPGWITGIY